MYLRDEKTRLLNKCIILDKENKKLKHELQEERDKTRELAERKIKVILHRILNK